MQEDLGRRQAEVMFDHQNQLSSNMHMLQLQQQQQQILALPPQVNLGAPTYSGQEDAPPQRQHYSSGHDLGQPDQSALPIATSLGAQQSPPQSPKGTVALEDTNVTNTAMAQNTGFSTPINPTCKPFEPRRRLSEPTEFSGMLGDSLDFSPLRASPFTSRVQQLSPSQGAYMPRMERTTPTMGKGRLRPSIDQTIHEEDEDSFISSYTRA